MNNQNDYIEAAQQIIASLGLPRAQQNERSALCLLALLTSHREKHGPTRKIRLWALHQS